MINEESKKNYPTSWEVVKLGDFADSEKGKKPKNQQPLQNEEFHLPYIDIEAFEKGIFKSFTDGEKCVICDDSDFLMVWDGSRSGLVGKGIKGALGSTLVRINLPMINNLYGYYYLQSKYLEINTRAKGVGIPHVDPALLWSYDFPIPPVNEQNRIVDKIETLFSEVDAGIGNLTLAKRQLEQYRQSLLKHAFEGKLTAKWREEYAEKHGKSLPSADELLEQIKTARQDYYDQQIVDWERAVKDWEEQGKEGSKPRKPSKLEDVKLINDTKLSTILPSCWSEQYLESISIISGGLTKNASRKILEEQVPYLRVANVHANELLLDDISYIGIKESEKPRTLLQENDLLIVEGNGSIEHIGRVALWTGEIHPCYHQNHLIKARIFEMVEPKYILYFLLSATGRERIVKVASSTTGLHTLSLSKVSNLIIPLASLAEQKQIVELLESKLSDAERLIDEIDTQLKKATLLKTSILHKAFQGKLVPQDPNDPPASELLEQIKAEREAKALAEKQAKQDKAASKSKAKTKSSKTPKKSKKDEQITLPL